MTVTIIKNERGETLVGIFNKKETKQLVLIVHDQQGKKKKEKRKLFDVFNKYIFLRA